MVMCSLFGALELDPPLQFVASWKVTTRLTTHTHSRLKFGMLYYNTFTLRGNPDAAQAQLFSLNTISISLIS